MGEKAPFKTDLVMGGSKDQHGGGLPQVTLNQGCEKKGSGMCTDANSHASLGNAVPPPGKTEHFTLSFSARRLILVS